jgi:WD40 repeat protein
VGLGPTLYLWDGDTGDVSMFMDFDPTQITAVCWDASGTHVAVGMADNTVLMFNVAQQKQVRIMRGHTGRVTSLAWNGATLTSGGAGEGVMVSDVRVKQHCTAMLKFHDKEICGLAWNNDGDQLSSGAADNLLAVWDNRCALLLSCCCSASRT